MSKKTNTGRKYDYRSEQIAGLSGHTNILDVPKKKLLVVSSITAPRGAKA